jgi:hypothetical protein
VTGNKEIPDAMARPVIAPAIAEIGPNKSTVQP